MQTFMVVAIGQRGIRNITSITRGGFIEFEAASQLNHELNDAIQKEDRRSPYMYFLLCEKTALQCLETARQFSQMLNKDVPALTPDLVLVATKFDAENA